MKNGDIPQFGVLQGINVLCIGKAIGGPFAATLMGELGANVIYVEDTTGGDSVGRTSLAWSLDHRNQRCIALDIVNSTGAEVFSRLARWAHIWIESSRGGTHKRWGLSDEVVWKENPKLVIVHFSGYGQSGVEDYVKRPGYDGIAQAFSGYMYWNGIESGPPLRVKPYTADFVPSVFAAFSSVAALHRVRQTGIGESIDLAQYEIMVRIQSSYLQNAINSDHVEIRTGNKEARWSVYDVFLCADETSVVIMILGKAMWKQAIPILGLSKDPEFLDEIAVAWSTSAAAVKADNAIARFCLTRTGIQVEEELNGAGIACSRVLSPKEMVDHPHYKSRETFTEWYDEIQGRMLKGSNIFPRFANNPTRIWRGGPAYNEDTEDILNELGYSSNEIRELYIAGACVKNK